MTVSHVVAYTNIVYPEACIANGTLAKALDELGMELVPNKKTFNWYGSWVKDYHQTDAAYKQGIEPETYGKCEHVIRVKGAPSTDYEIGLVKNPNGEGFVPVLDFFGTGNKLRHIVGSHGEHLGTAYNRMAIKHQAALGGYTVTEEAISNDKVKLVATRYGV
jgi:hypothetical protein